MSLDDDLVRLRPFPGLCLTPADLLVEQRYHQRSLQRHARFLSGHGVVQGLSVDLVQELDRYVARVTAGYGLSSLGQGVYLAQDLVFMLEEQQADGDYLLWLVRDEHPDPEALRPVFDTTDQSQSARIVEVVTPILRPVQAEELPHGVALAKIRVRLGRMARLHVPMPRAGRVSRAAESALKPQVTRFIERSRRVIQLLFRTTTVQEMSVETYGFYSALVSAEFLLIEEGTADRVLYRTAGSLVRHGRAFFDADAVHGLTDRLQQLADLVREAAEAVPEAHQEDQEWQRWFERFERLLPKLERALEELQTTVDPDRDVGL
jgi:hypothetical protein